MRIFSLLRALLVCGLVAVQVSAQTPSVSTLQGTVNGVVVTNAQGSVNAYKGIPYARPPTAQLRFAPPVSTAAASLSSQNASSVVAGRLSTDGSYNARAFAPLCLQPCPTCGNTSTTQLQGSENCLFLNVYTPTTATATSNLPVYVWIPGGGFITGGADSYPGENLVTSALGAQALGSQGTDGIIVVTLNYRLGVFGFLALPLLGAQNAPGTVASSGNQGIRDQIAALQWVQRNIAAYGGNPAAVTVGGESAGAISVCILVASPLASGLFARAILESGGCDNSGNNQATVLSAAERVGQRFVPFFAGAIAQQAGLAPTNTQLQSLNSLCQSSSAELVLFFCLRVDNPQLAPLFLAAANATGVNAFFAQYAMIPMVDGAVATDYAGNSLRDGKFAAVPMLLGSNGAEMFAFLQGATAQFGDATQFSQATVDRYAAAYGNGSAEIAAYYQVTQPQFAAFGPFAPIKTLESLLSRAIFQCPTLRLAQAALAKGLSVYSYRFDYVDELGGASYRNLTRAAIHAGELPYVFNTPTDRSFPFFTETSYTIKSTVQNYWIKFIMTGDPNYGTVPLPALTTVARGALTTEPPTWPLFTTSNTALVFGLNGAVASADVYPDCAQWRSTVVTTATPYQAPISLGTPAQQEAAANAAANGNIGAAGANAAPSALIAAFVAALALAFARSA